MKISISFFSPDDNKPKPAQTIQAKPTGYISNGGKIVFPASTLEELGIDGETYFKIGTDQKKRAIKSLYLVPTTEQAGAFKLEQGGRGQVIALANILKKGGINYNETKFVFTASIFTYSEGVIGYELELSTSEPKEKKPYTGKPRGRRAKVQSEE